MDEESAETTKKYFNELAKCACCPIHQRDRPLSYAHDPELDNRRMSKAQEEALNTLSTDDYIEWCNADSERRNLDILQCDCQCRTGTRTMVRRIPPPSSYDWYGK